MIYTLTCNPAIDMNITADSIQQNKVNRTNNVFYSPNGKGLNVSFVLGHFGLESKILGYFGGFSGKYIVDETRKRGFEIIPIWVEDTTRINIFLNDGFAEYKFLNQGSYIKQEENNLISILGSLPDLDYLCISGSLPPGILPEYYEEILTLCNKKGVKVILDISSPKLKDLLAFRPYLIKPNDDEIKDIFGINISSESDVKEAVNLLYRLGAQNILLTMGEKGSYFFQGNRLYFANTQKVDLLSSACAGDASLAAFLSIWLENPDDIENSMKRSAATGANVAESRALGDLSKVTEYFNHIKVKEVL